MKKKILISILSVLIVVGGFFVVRGFTQTGVTALDDSFTREFLDEDVEVGEGFYFYEARNGNYTMWFPEDYYIESRPPSFLSENHYELINLFQDESNGRRNSMQIVYDGSTNQDLETTDNLLQNITEDLSYNNVYDSLEENDNTIYFGRSHLKLEGKNLVAYNPEEYPANRFFALIHNEDGSKAISIDYRLECEDQECDPKEEEKFFGKVIRSIDFK